MKTIHIQAKKAITIDDLTALWNQGWRSFAELATEMGLRDLTQPFSDADLDPTMRMFAGFGLMLNALLPQGTGFKSIAVMHDVKSPGCRWDARNWEPGQTFLRSSKVLAPTLKELTGAFARSRTVRDALFENLRVIGKPGMVPIETVTSYGRMDVETIAALFEGRAEFLCEPTGCHYLYVLLPLAAARRTAKAACVFECSRLDDTLSSRIDSSLAAAMEWLARGTESTELAEEAFWNCFWLAMQPPLTVLRQVRDCIRQDLPVTDEQLGTLRGYISVGIVSADWVRQEDGKQSFRVQVEPPAMRHRPQGYHSRDMTSAFERLLCGPAFALAREFERSTQEPRFIRTCRAPSCRKVFWTGRAEATNCPGSQGGKKNTCSLEWNRYRRFLRDKKHVDPEERWDDEQFRQDFIRYDNDRT